MSFFVRPPVKLVSKILPRGGPPPVKPSSLAGKPRPVVPIPAELVPHLRATPADLREMALAAHQIGLPIGQQIYNPISNSFSGVPPSYATTEFDLPERKITPGTQVKVGPKIGTVVSVGETGARVSFGPTVGTTEVPFGELSFWPESPPTKGKRLVDSPNSYARRKKFEEEMRAIWEEKTGKKLTDDELVLLLLATGHAPLEPEGVFESVDDSGVSFHGIHRPGERLVADPREAPSSLREQIFYPSDERMAWNDIIARQRAEELRDKPTSWALQTDPDWRGGPLGVAINTFGRPLLDLGKRIVSESIPRGPSDIPFALLRTAGVNTSAPRMLLEAIEGKKVSPDNFKDFLLEAFPSPPVARAILSKRTGADALKALNVASEPFTQADRLLGVMTASVLSNLPGRLGDKMEEFFYDTDQGVKFLDVTKADLAGAGVGLLIPGYGIPQLGRGKLVLKATKEGQFIAVREPQQVSFPKIPDLRGLLLSRASAEGPDAVTLSEARSAFDLSGLFRPGPVIGEREVAEHGVVPLHGVALDLSRARKILAHADKYLESAPLLKKTATQMENWKAKIDDLELVVSGIERGLIRNQFPSEKSLPMVARLLRKHREVEEEFIQEVENLRLLQREQAILSGKGEPLGKEVLGELSYLEGKRLRYQVFTPEGKPRPLSAFADSAEGVIVRNQRKVAKNIENLKKRLAIAQENRKVLLSEAKSVRSKLEASGQSLKETVPASIRSFMKALREGAESGDPIRPFVFRLRDLGIPEEYLVELNQVPHIGKGLLNKAQENWAKYGPQINAYFREKYGKGGPFFRNYDEYKAFMVDTVRRANTRIGQYIIELRKGTKAREALERSAQRLVSKIEAVDSHIAFLKEEGKEKIALYRSLLEEQEKALMEELGKGNFITADGRLLTPVGPTPRKPGYFRLRVGNDIIDLHRDEFKSLKVIRRKLVEEDSPTWPGEYHIPGNFSAENILNPETLLREEFYRNRKTLEEVEASLLRLSNIIEKMGVGPVGSTPGTLNTNDVKFLSAYLKSELTGERYGFPQDLIERIPVERPDGTKGVVWRLRVPWNHPDVQKALDEALEVLEETRVSLIGQIAADKRKVKLMARAMLPEFLEQTSIRVKQLGEYAKKLHESLFAITNPEVMGKKTYLTLPERVEDSLVNRKILGYRIREGVDINELSDNAKSMMDFLNQYFDYLLQPVRRVRSHPSGIPTRREIEAHFKAARTLYSNYVSSANLMREVNLPYAQEKLAKMLLSFDAQKAVVASFAKTRWGVLDSDIPVARGAAAAIDWAKLGFLRRIISGTVLSPRGQALLTHYDNTASWAEFHYSMSVGSFAETMRSMATAKGIPGRTSTQRLSTWLRRNFDREALKGLMLSTGQALRKDPQGNIEGFEQFVDAISDDLFFFVFNPELWKREGGDIPEGVFKLAKSLRTHFEKLEAAIALEGGEVRLAGVFSHLLHPKLRKANVVPADSALQTLINAYNWIQDPANTQIVGRFFREVTSHRPSLSEDPFAIESLKSLFRVPPLRNFLRSGEDQLGGILANLYRRYLNRTFFREVFSQIRDPQYDRKLSEVITFNADGGVSLGPGALQAIKKEYREDFKNIVGLLDTQRTFGIGQTLINIAKNLAIGRLIADLTILGVQTPMFIASNIFTNPKAVTRAFQHMFKLVNDEEWFHWVMANNDELGMYIRNGLRIGTEAYLGGEFQPGWWLEHVPIFGAFGKAGSAFNDIQFTRWLMYMKVQTIRTHMHTWNTLRNFKETMAGVEQEVDGLNLINKELNGRYWTADRQEVLRAVIRTVNNQLGGIPRSSYGTGAVREVAERLLLLVPGFFRARTGLVLTALNNPASAEGALSASVIARELLFAGGLSYFLSALFGDLDRWEYDLRNSRSFSIALEDAHISVIPSPGVYRMFARLAGGFSSGDSYKNPMDRFRVAQYVLESRLSPLASAQYNLIRQKDFLGRRYDSIWESLLNESMILAPIFAEQSVEAVRESNGDWSRITTQTVSELFGRTYYPKRPVEYLDELVEKHYPEDYANGARWATLDRARKDNLRLLEPETTERWEHELEAEIWSRASDKERVEIQIREGLSNLRETLYEEKININGVVSSQAQDDELMMKGHISRAQWKTRYDERQTWISGRFAQYENILMEVFGADSFDEVRAKYFKEHSEKGDLSGAFLALYEISLLDPNDPQFLRLHYVGGQEIWEVDYEAYDKAIDAILTKYPPEIAHEVRRRMVAERTPAERMLDEAKEELSGYMQIPKYVGFSKEEGEKIDNYRKFLNNTVTYMRAMGIEADQIEAADLRAGMLRALVELGFIDSQEEVRLAAVAYDFETNEEAELKYLNVLRPAYALQHPNMVMFFPWTASNLPLKLRPLLPEGIAPDLDVELLDEKESPFK